MDDIDTIVHDEIRKYLLKIASGAEKVGRNHPEITLLQFAAVMRIAAADVDENWEIEKFIEKI
jgi:hypothetical protein